MRYGTWRPGTPNMQPSRFGEKLTAVVVHRMVGYLFGTDSWFKTSASGASTHFGIGWASIQAELTDDVSTYQWVDTNDTAWGWSAQPTDKVEPLAASVLHPSPDLNRQVIHIELAQYHEEGANLATQPFRPSIYRELNKLLDAIAQEHPRLVLLEHNDVSSKPCPGPIEWGRISGGYGSILVAGEDPDVIADLERRLEECRLNAISWREKAQERYTRIEALKVQRDELKADLAEMEALVAELEGGRVPELEGKVIALRERVTKMKALVAALALDIEEA